MAHSCNDLFDYTSGRWIINDALRHAERRRVFNVDGLCQLAAKSVNRSPDDIVNLTKLAKGGFNRTFLITMCDDFQMVARIPYPATVPKDFAVASEVATMDLLRSSGLPVPEVYGYSPPPTCSAGVENHVDCFPGWRKPVLCTRRGEVGPGAGHPASGPAFLRRSRYKPASVKVKARRGPEAALVGAAHKEMAYLKQFGQSLLPFQRVRREGYWYQEQPPLDHIENLNRYLLIASSFVSRNPALNYFCIRHPDLQQNNIIVSRSPRSKWQIVGLLDWQHASVLPLFLLAGVPGRLQKYGDPISQSMAWPSLPENLDDLDETEKSRAKELYRRRLVHYHYVKNTEECNELHYAALTDPMGMLRRRLFYCASDPWEGETLALKVALIEATENWKTLTGGDAPCPIVFDADDVRETMKLDGVQRGADEVLEACRNMIGFEPEGWVSTEHYEKAMIGSKQLKNAALAAAESAEEWAEIAAHWPLDDMDEEKYK